MINFIKNLFRRSKKPIITFPIREGDYLILWESYPEIKGEMGVRGPVGVRGPMEFYFEHLKKTRLEKISLIKSLFNY